MGVRLILVSVVAGLGLTLPSGKQITSWRDSAQGWVSIRLAEWDARMPANESAFVYVADADALPSEEHETRKLATTTKTPDTSPTDSPAPVIIVSTSASTSLEILASGIETPTSPMAIDDVELMPIALETNTASDLVALDTAFLEAQEQTLSAFAVEAIQIAITEKTLSNSEEHLAVTDQLISVEPSVLEDSDDLQEGSSYLFAIEEIVKPAQPDINVNQSPNEALDVEGDLYLGAAFQLNRQAEGLNSLLKNEIGQTVSNDSQSEMSETSSPLGSALKLTREAVYAWANLLHAPAVVTINH